MGPPEEWDHPKNEKDKQLKLRKMTVAGVAIAAALTMSACSSNSNDTAASTTAAKATTTAAASTAAYPPVPTPADLNAALARSFDPAVPIAEKTSLVQGAEQDPALINKVADAAAKNNAHIQVVDVTDLGDGTLNAGITTTINGQSNPGTVTFVAENGVWKLSKNDACGIVAMAQLTSPACA